MPRKDKYYGTNINISGEKLDKLKQLGYKGHHSQFRVVCRAKSMAEVNRIAESYGLGSKCFHKDYTCETGNKIELEMAEKYGFIVCLNETLGDKFISIEEIL